MGRIDRLEDRSLLSATLFVSQNFADAPLGSDPDGDGPAASFGTDSFASIQAAVDAASPGDTIVVAAGIYSENLTLSRDVTLAGETGVATDVVIASMSGDGVTVGGTATTVAMTGLSIDAGGGTAVRMSLEEGTARLTLDNVLATNAANDGLFVGAVDGATAIVELRDVAFDGAGNHALHIAAQNGSTVTVTGERLSGAHAGVHGVHIVSADSTTHVSLTDAGSFANAGTDGINAHIDGGPRADFQLDVSGRAGAPADFSGAGRHGMLLTFNNYVGFDESRPNFTFDHARFDDAAVNGFSLISNGTSPGNESTFHGLVTDSTFDNAGRHAWEANLVGNAPESHIRFVDSTMRNAGVDAMHLAARGSTRFGVDIIDGDLTGAGRENVTVIQDGGSQVDLFIDPTPMDRGFKFEGQDGTVLNAHLLDSPLSKQARPANFGIFGTLETGATMNLTVENSEIEFAVRDGMHVTATGGSTLNATFINSRIFRSGMRGVFLDLDASTANVAFTQGSTITDSTGNNFALIANNGSRANVSFDATSGNLRNAGRDGLVVHAHGAGTNVEVVFAGVANLNNAQRNGISLVATTNGRVNVRAMNGLNVDNAGNSAISIFGNSGQMGVVANNVSMANAGGNAYQAIVGAGSRVITQLSNVSSMAGAGGDAINFHASNSFLALGFAGNSETPLSLNDAERHGVQGTTSVGATLVFNLHDFTIDNAQRDGIRLDLSQTTMLTSNIRNGVISNNGHSVANSSGIVINATNNAMIGIRGTAEVGLRMDNLLIENTEGLPRIQDHGLRITADDGGYVRTRLMNSTIRRHAGHGIRIDANPDNSTQDRALVDAIFGFVNVTSNSGDGVHLNATNGTSSINAIDSGIIFTFSFGEIALNGNGVLGDGLGDGIEANAVGDPNGGTANTTIVVNLNDAQVVNNEELPFNFNALSGGLVKLGLTGGVFGGPVHICADGPTSSAALSLDNVRIIPVTDVGGTATGPGVVLCATNGGTAVGSFSNMTGTRGIREHGGQGVVFLAETGGTVEATFTNVDIASNLINSTVTTEPMTGLPVRAAVQGRVHGAGSSATVDFTNVRIIGHRLNGFELEVLEGGVFDSTIRNLTLRDNNADLGEGDFDVTVDGAGSSATFDIDGLKANGSKGRGIDFQATNGAALDISQFNNVEVFYAAQDGLNVAVDGGSTLAPLEITNSIFHGALNGHGINFNVDTSGAPGPVELSMLNVSANNARRTGMLLNINGSADGGTHSVNLVNASANNALGGRGLFLGIGGLLSGEAADVFVTGSSFNSATISGADIQLRGSAGSTASLELEGVSATNAGATGVNLFFGNGIDVLSAILNDVVATGATTVGLNVTAHDPAVRLRELEVTNSSFSGAGNDGVRASLDNQSVPADVTMTNVAAENTGFRGVALTMNNVRGGASSATFTAISADKTTNPNAGGVGLDVRGTGLNATDSIHVTVDGASSFNNAGSNGVEIQVGGVSGSTATIELDDVSAANAAGIGINIGLQGAITAAIDRLNDVDASGAGAIGLNVQVLGDNRLTNLDSSNADFSSAGSHGVILLIDVQDTPAAIRFDRLDADDAGGRGVAMNLNTVTGGESSVTLTNVTARNAAIGSGLDLDVTSLGTGDAVDIEIASADFSGAAGNAARVNVTGGGTATIDIDGLTVSNSGNDGLRLTLSNGVQATVERFNDVVARNNVQNGLNFMITTGAQLLTFEADGLDLSNNSAMSTTAAGMNVVVHNNNSVANIDLKNLTINNTIANFGKGVNLNVQHQSLLNFDIIGGSIANTGREGIDMNVGTTNAGSTFVGHFENLSVTNSGTAPQVFVNGIDVDATGAGTSAEVSFDAVSSDGHSTGDGYNFFVAESARLEIDITGGSSGSDNGARGLALLARGTDTRVALFSHSAGGPVNTFDNNGSLSGAPRNGGHGVDIRLQNGNLLNPLRAEFELEASANSNFGDGIRLIANDRTGIRIDSLGVTATNVDVDGNGGNGLLVDLDTVTGINDFDLAGMTVSNNTEDQIHVRLANMTLGAVTFNDVVATGPGANVGTGDGLELTLDGTTVTDTLGLERVRATQNGQDGLQINLLNGASIPPGSLIDVGTFNNNGQHGIHVSLDEATAELDIRNSTAPFGTIASASNNGAAGINVTLEIGSMLLMDIDRQTINANGTGIAVSSSGNSTFNLDGGVADNRITNNTITNNSQFGFRGIFLGGQFDLSLGNRDVDGQGGFGEGNLFNNNAGAGITVDLIQNAVGRIAIVDNQITGTSNNTANAAFNGDGIFVRMLGSGVGSPASSTLIDNIDGGPGLLIAENHIGVTRLGSAAGNARFGVNFDVREQSEIRGLEILESTVSNNGAGGIEFRRRDRVEVHDFIIDANQIENNAGNGIGIFGQNSSLTMMTVTIGRDTDNDTVNRRQNITNWLNTLDGNRIANNSASGVHLFVQADSRMQVDMQENMIVDNDVHGIIMLETALSGDAREITGNWEQNVIANNAQRGVHSNARIDIAATESIIGAVFDPFGNVLIDGNGGTGVWLNGLGFSRWNDIDIIRNGRLVTGNRAEGHGVDIQGSSKQVVVENSLIQRNFQDGVEIHAGTFINARFTDNRVNDNVGRGYDVLTQGNGTLWLTIEGTNDPRQTGGLGAFASASSNGEEGIYIVNTPAGGQNQTDFSFTPLAQDGGVLTPVPHSNVRITNVDISFNGNDIGQEGNRQRPAASGLVVRVGSSDAQNGVGDVGGFASTTSSGLTPTGRNSSRGGVVMQVDRNYVNGNTGDGMFFHGYRATAPSGTGSAWPNTGTINNSGYQSDPLARLDLIWGVGGTGAGGFSNEFSGGDAPNVNNNNWPGGGGHGTPDNQSGAFYQTTDQNFKSRVSNPNTFADNPGPFSINNRRRNAQRQGVRIYEDGTQLPPNTNVGLVYPGMGHSTFRVRAFGGGGGNNDLIGGPFFFDDPDVFLTGAEFGPGSISGVAFTGASGFARGELPFGWGMF